MTRDRCPVCGANDIEELIVLEDYPFAGNGAIRSEAADQLEYGVLGIGFCHQCATMFQMEPVSFDQLDQMLLNQPAPLSEKETGVEIEESDRFLESLKRYIPPKGKILEIGCRSGYIMDKLMDMGYQVEGIDADPRAVELSTKAGFKVKEGRFDMDMYPDKSFDVIISRSILEHVIDPNTILFVMERLLKPGGIMAIEVPNVQRIFKRASFGGFQFHHVFYWTIPSLRYALTVQGLDLLGGYEESYIGMFGRKAEKGEERVSPILPDVESVEEIYDDAVDFLDRKEQLADEVTELVQERFPNGVTIFGAGTTTVDMLYYTGLSEEINGIVTSDKSRHGSYLAGTEIEIGPFEELNPEENDAVIISSERRQEELLEKLDDYQNNGGRIIRFAPDMEII